MSKFTGGPWKVIENGKGNFKHGIGTVNGAPVSAMIAYVCVDSVATDKEQRLANAHLIAAAPELLAALKELCADKYLADPINADRMKSARAAIRKATGE